MNKVVSDESFDKCYFGDKIVVKIHI